MADFNPNNYAPSYGGMIDSEGNVKNVADVINEDGRLKIEAELTVSDIQIGAVELKDELSNNRLKINADGSINMRVVGSIDGGTF